MRTIRLVQLGLGSVGRALAQQVLQYNQQSARRYNTRFVYAGIVDRSAALVDPSPAVVARSVAHKQAGGALRELPQSQLVNDWTVLLPNRPGIVIDVTAQDGTAPALVAAVNGGHRVVLANKKPLCGSYDQFAALTEAGRTRYEATVGAGLPVLSTLRMLRATGDHVESIEGCLSGTLGFLMTQLEHGVPFADAVGAARERGWTEPDPRDDLSGVDVARKALILARTCDIEADLEDVAVESLYPSSMAEIALDTFVEQLSQLNEEYQARYYAAVPNGLTLRYTARVSTQEQRVGIAEVELDSPTGALQGPDNLIVYHTQRYQEHPLSVRGPGAGATVTASAVLGDMLDLVAHWK